MVGTKLFLQGQHSVVVCGEHEGFQNSAPYSLSLTLCKWQLQRYYTPLTLC